MQIVKSRWLGREVSIRIVSLYRYRCPNRGDRIGGGVTAYLNWVWRMPMTPVNLGG